MEAKTEQISNWILEFLLRNPNLENLAKKSLSVLPIPADDPRLKKIVLLRTIECEITDGVVTESTLEALELVEELDSRRGLDVGDAMKTAYAAVAVDLTVRFLVGCGGKPEVKYLSALKRVWRVRVEALERSVERRSELLTGEFRRWWDELEAAIWDDGVCQRLMGLNTRNEAVAAVRAYLKEAWVLVGKLFINYGVRLMNEQEEKEGSVRVSREENKSSDKGMSLLGLIELTKKVNFEALNCGDEDSVTLPDSPATNRKESHREKAARQANTHIVRRPKGPVRISDDENSNTRILNTKYDSIPTPEVCKAKESLKSNLAKLKSAVTDPLPEAVQVAETVVSELVSLENRSVRETEAANLSSEPGEASDANLGSQQNGVPRPITTDANLGRPSCSQRNDVFANLGEPSCGQQNDVSRPITADANLGKPSGSQQNGGSQPVSAAANLWKPSCSNQNGVPRPSLMERNSTARTLEWDDSLDETPEAGNGKSKLHLPSPKKRLVSPLKKYEPTKLSKRRKVKRWSLLEEDTLRTGVQKFGKGNWKLILHSYRDVFEERTEVDLKDKWRNLMR